MSLLIIFLIVVTLLKLLNQIENSLNILAIDLFSRMVHIALDRFEFRKLKNKSRQI